MENIEYKSNSHKSKAEIAASSTNDRPKVEKVVTGQVKVKKKGELSKIKDGFISEEAPNVWKNLLVDAIVPTMQRAISDLFRNGVDILLYSVFGDSTRTTTKKPGQHVSYTSYYERKREDDRRYSGGSVTRAGYSFDDIVIDSRSEAEEVLNQLDDIIATYGFARVADLYDLVGVTGNYTDNNYGWTNIRNAKAVRTRDGSYMLDLPRAISVGK